MRVWFFNEVCVDTVLVGKGAGISTHRKNVTLSRVTAIESLYTYDFGAYTKRIVRHYHY